MKEKRPKLYLKPCALLNLSFSKETWKKKGIFFAEMFGDFQRFLTTWNYFNYFIYFSKVEEPAKVELSRAEQFLRKYKAVKLYDFFAKDSIPNVKVQGDKTKV